VWVFEEDYTWCDHWDAWLMSALLILVEGREKDRKEGGKATAKALFGAGQKERKEHDTIITMLIVQAQRNYQSAYSWWRTE